jgi:hypothetical protein
VAEASQRIEGGEGVVLPARHTGSSLYHSLLTQACAAFPQALAPAELPSDPGTFKRDYGDVLARFEAARVVAPERVEIARHLVRASQDALEHADGSRRISLREHMAAGGAAPELHSLELGAGPGLRPELALDAQIHRGRNILAAAERLAEAQHMTQAALRALRWILEHIEAQGGNLDLRGQSFVSLGAGAELAATRMLLEAGARVLWIDRTDPAALLARREGLAGTLVQPSSGGDLLRRPRDVVAAIRAFAERHGPVHLGMFAYASGSSQEWRLGAVMHAIVAQLPAEILRSVSLLVSPTTVSTLQPECTAAAREGLAHAARWKSALRLAGLLRAPGYHPAHGVEIARATVSVQGLSYQAAQHVSKLMVAETFAVHGNRLEAEARRPLTVSANVAGITRTRSLEHPLFQAAFIGASHFGVRIFDPPATRTLSGLLILHDLLNPGAPGAAGVQPADAPAKAAALFSQQVHGGIYSLPYALEHTIRMAALIGMGRRPSVLLRGSTAKAGRGA